MQLNVECHAYDISSFDSFWSMEDAKCHSVAQVGLELMVILLPQSLQH